MKDFLIVGIVLIIIGVAIVYIIKAKKNGAKSVELWGTGTPLREFLYVDDMADACVFLLENYSGEQHVNIGTGKEVSIKELAETVQSVVGYTGKIVWNTEMPVQTCLQSCWHDLADMNLKSTVHFLKN